MKCSLGLAAIVMIVLVLLQRGKGGGLAGALGGMGGQSAFGTKAGDLFTKITIGVASFWILISLLVAINYKHLGGPTLNVTPVNAPNQAAVPAPLGGAPVGSGGKTESVSGSPDKSGKTPAPGATNTAPGAAEKSTEKGPRGANRRANRRRRADCRPCLPGRSRRARRNSWENR